MPISPGLIAAAVIVSLVVVLTVFVPCFTAIIPDRFWPDAARAPYTIRSGISAGNENKSETGKPPALSSAWIAVEEEHGNTPKMGGNLIDSWLEVKVLYPPVILTLTNQDSNQPVSCNTTASEYMEVVTLIYMPLHSQDLELKQAKGIYQRSPGLHDIVLASMELPMPPTVSRLGPDRT